MAICNNKKCSLGECDQPKACAAYVPVVTNADRFRAMSNEEQQNFVRKFWEIEDFADWLKQTAK